MNPIEILSFKDQRSWSIWLSENHTLEQGIWLKIFKKNSNEKSVTYSEAVDEALCFGWIDGVAHKYDDESYIQKFTPRRKKSIWSKINIGKVERLLAEGRIQPPGLAQIEAAKADGRWAQAYDSPTTMTIPEDFMAELKKDEKAYAFFQTLNKTNIYAIGWRLQTAKKPETRERRKQALLEMLKKGEKLH